MLSLILKRSPKKSDNLRLNITPTSIPACIFDLRKKPRPITVYRTGKYIITGPTSEEELLFDLRERFLRFLSDMDVIENATDEWFSVQNYVCTEDLGQTLDLNALSIGLGLERTEYEPEQFRVSLPP